MIKLLNIENLESAGKTHSHSSFPSEDHFYNFIGFISLKIKASAYSGSAEAYKKHIQTFRAVYHTFGKVDKVGEARL